MKKQAGTAALVILVIVGVLSVYSSLMVPTEISPADTGTDYAFGYYLGRALFPLLGLAAFIRLVTRKRGTDESPTGKRFVTVGAVSAGDPQRPELRPDVVQGQVGERPVELARDDRF